MHPIADLLVCLRFFSRLPVPATRREIDLGGGGLAAAAWMAPVAGALIGGLAALVLVATSAAGLPPLLAAPLAIAASLLVTGALHEDGLADCADGFGGGRTPTRKLEIMRDSRIGTFGACAIALSLYLRAAALGIVTARSPGLAAAVLITAGALSRTACLAPLVWLPPARRDGAGAATQPSVRTFGVALVLAVALALYLCGATPAVERLAVAGAAAGAVSFGWCALARRQIGGQTGDVAGAAAQICEIAALCALLIGGRTV